MAEVVISYQKDSAIGEGDYHLWMVKETRNGLQYRLDANTGVAGPSLC
jgi:hypothetical protein